MQRKYDESKRMESKYQKKHFLKNSRLENNSQHLIHKDSLKNNMIVLMKMI